MKFLSDILAKAGLVVDGVVTLNSVANATTDTDKFIVVDSGVVKYRTGAQLLSDIGGQVAGSYVPTSRTLTINGVVYDLSADRTWTITAGVSSVSAGSGISVNQTTGAITVTNTGLLSATAGSGISVSTVSQNLNIVNTGLLSATAGTGISVSTVSQNLNIVNTGLLSATAGSGISVSTTSQNVNIVNTGLLSATAGAGISVSVVSGNLNIINTITDNNQLANGAGYATTSYVTTQINNLVAGAPGLLDTLDELAAALGDDPNFATTITTALSNRLRVDTATQGLTSTQQSNGRTNLGLGSLATLSSIGNAYITDLAWSKITGAPSFLTAEADTLATVTARGASTSTQSTFNGGIKFGNATLNPSGDQNHIHFNGTAIIPNTTTTANNAMLGSGSYRWSTIYGGGLDLSGSATVTGNVTAAKYIVGSSLGTSPIVVNTGANESQLLFKKTSQSTFSVLTWDGSVFLTSNIYYTAGTWVHDAPSGNNNNQLFRLAPGTGVIWYASNNGSGSWNVASELTLWNDSGVWQRPVSSVSGTTNYISKFTSGTAVGNSQIFDNGTLIGIGTTSAYIDSNDKFIVSGGRFAVNALAYSAASFNRSTAGNVVDILVGGYGKGALNSDGTNLNVLAYTDLILSSGSSERVRILSTGNVGLNNINPTVRFEVNTATSGYTGFTGSSNAARFNTVPGSGQSTALLLTQYLGDLSTDTTVDLDFAAVDSNSVLGSQPHARIGYTGAYNDGINVAPDYEARGYFRIATRSEGSGGALVDRFLIDHNGTLRLSNYSTNGFLKVSSSNGTVIVDSNTYLTSYTETDTLATVTSRGNTTTGRINVRSNGNQGGGNILMGNTGNGSNKWSYLTGTHYNQDTQTQGVSIIGAYSDLNSNTVVIGGSIYEANPATEIQFWTHTATTHNLGGSKRMVIDTNGNVGINVNSPSNKFQIGSIGSSGYGGNDLVIGNGTQVFAIWQSTISNIYTNTNFAFQGAGGSGNLNVGYSSDQGYKFAANGTGYFSSNLTVGGTITEQSAARFKENIAPVTAALEKVDQLQPVSYNKKGSITKEIGLIAEDVFDIYPEFVLCDDGGEPIGIHYSRLTAVLIESVKELKKEINELKNRN